MKVLAIAAHPDDETLGCGGTLARHVLQGDEVTVMIMTDNFRSPDILSYAKDAMKVLGVQKHYFFAYPDSTLEQKTILEMAELVEHFVSKNVPDIVYTHYEHDLSIDHRITFQVTLTVFRSVWNKPISIYAFEVPSGSDWGFHQFSPAHFVDISGTLETKLNALSCYETETRPFPHPRSEESIRSRAKVWGSYSGLKAAEGFQVVRSVV